MMLSFREKAEYRASQLWEYYNENGQLSLKDFERITEGRYASVLATFETYGIDAPLVYNSRKEKTRRKAEALREKAIELGEDFLTINQAAQVLNEKVSRVMGIEGRILRYGFDIPQIKMGKKLIATDKDDSGNGRINGTINPLNYPSGLQVLRWWLNRQSDEIHYLIR